MQKTIGRFFSFFTAMLLCMNMFTVFTAGAEESMQTDEEPTMSNDMSIEGSNSFGTMLAKEISGKQEEQLENNGCNVFSVEVSGQTAKVDFETTEDLSLVVAIYEEDGVKMLTSAETDVTAEQTDVEVTFEEQLPQYFYVRAFLVEKESLKPMCAVYETPNYTKEMQEFFAKTTDDFDEERVLNLDEDKTNNFAVFSEDTRIIENAGDKNVLVSSDDEKLTYVFENADESISGLKKDDIFTYALEDGMQLIVKVDSVKTDGSKVTIVGQDTSMEDVFEYVKINETSGGSAYTFDDSEMDKSIAVVDNDLQRSLKKAVEIDETVFDICKTFKFLDKSNDDDGDSSSISNSSESNTSVDIEANITGEFELGVSMPLEIYISKTQQYINFKLDYSVKLSIAFENSVSVSVKLGEFSISPVAGLHITITPTFVVSGVISAEITAAALEGTVGFCYSSETGVESLTSTPDFNTPISGEGVNFSAEGSVFVGISFKPKVSIINDAIAFAEADGTLGVEFNVSTDNGYKFDLKSEEEMPDVNHLCNVCFEGTIKGKFTMEFEVKLFNSDVLTFDAVLLDTNVNIKDFYYSYDYKEFKWTTCPHKEYKVTVKVADKYSSAVKDALINGETSTDKDGIAILYFKEGDNKVTVTKNGYKTAEQSFEIDENQINRISQGLKYTVNVNLEKEESSSKPDSSSEADSSSNSEIVGEEIQQVSLGGYHSACITKDGKLYTWGLNNYGQLGDRTTEYKATPVKIMDNVVQVSLGYLHSACITKDGSLYTWGRNENGQLGDGTTEDRYEPVKIMDNVAQVSLGSGYSACITKDGKLYTWGYNNYGQLGNGTTENRYEPVEIMDNVVSVSLGACHSACIAKDDSLYTWGSNGNGRLGDRTTEDKCEPVKIMNDVVSVSLGASCSACITKDGNLYTWGYSGYCQLGDRTTEDRYEPIKIMNNVVQANFGYFYSICITKDGGLYTWGENRCGELGDGTIGNRHEPLKIMDDVAQISLGLGNEHNACITKDGNLYTWGGNWDGQLGDGTTTNKYTPTPITIPTETTRNLNSAANPTSLKSVESSKTNQFKFTDIENLEPNTVYNIYVMKDKSAENPLSTENLLCITQTKTDENGNITTKYAPKAEIAGAETFAVNFADDEENEQPEIVIGDVDFSGTINSSDALKVLIHIVGVKRLDENQFKAADTNGDNEITTIDALNILKYVVGLISQFTA